MTQDNRVQLDAIIDELSKLAAQVEALRQDATRPISTTYLTVEDATAYLKFQTVNAFRHWVREHGVPKFRRGGRVLLFLRRDLDEAVGNRARQKRTEAGRGTR